MNNDDFDGFKEFESIEELNWAWLFVNEKPPMIVIAGGVIVIIAVLLQFFHQYKLSK